MEYLLVVNLEIDARTHSQADRIADLTLDELEEISGRSLGAFTVGRTVLWDPDGQPVFETVPCVHHDGCRVTVDSHSAPESTGGHA